MIHFGRCLALLLASVLLARVSASDIAWIEAENPTTKPELAEFETRPDGTAEYLSGGKVAVVNIDERHVEKLLGKDGKIAAWDFETKTGGMHQVWARIGYEWVRTDFDWRIDSGAWQTAKSTDCTIDLQQIAFWREIAWLKMGEQDLPAGKHSLQVRFMPTRESKGQQVPTRILWMADCFCIADDFRPNHKYRPGDDYRSDLDRQAAAQVFTLVAPAQQGERARLDLGGSWQLAAWDEPVVPEAQRLEGVAALPADLDSLPWYGIPVPSDRNQSRPDFIFNHRLIYRTKVAVPASLKDRAFYLDFDSFSMIATVFVNGVRCGWSRAFYTNWQCDISQAIKPGQVNDIIVVIKDEWYAQSGFAKDPLGARRVFNMPPDFMAGSQSATMTFDMPMSGNNQNGLLRPVALVAAGTVYADDVFVKPSVTRHELGIDVTLRNPGPTAAEVHLDVAIVPWAAGGTAGSAAKTFTGKDVSVPAGAETVVTLSEGWADPKLWWPDEPNLYQAVTTVVVDGKPTDIARTRFGFREWEWDSHLFKLNGIITNLRATIDYGKTGEEYIASCKHTGQNMIRLWGTGLWGKTRRQNLDFFDEQGMPVRASGIFDGEGCNYRLAMEGKPNTPLFDHWREQLAAWVKTERNHPSIFIWSVENEITFINSCNFGLCDLVEPEIRKGAALVESLDPTRPTMVDGGRCLKAQTMPVNGCHYNDVFGRDLPDIAYHSRDIWYQHTEHGPWLMVKDRPIFHGEVFFAAGQAPSEFSLLDGDRCFLGPAEAKHGKGLYGRMISEGWRWDEVAAFHFWTDFQDGSWISSWQPVALFCRQWNWTFASGSTITRTLKVFNDTRFDRPIEADWSLTVGGTVANEGKRTFQLQPGTAQEFEVTIPVPTVSQRTAASFSLTCRRDGLEVFRDVKPAWVIDPDAAAKPNLAQVALAVVDPSGVVTARLAKRGIPFTAAAGPEQVPSTAQVVVVGPDAIAADHSNDPAWLALAASGVKVLVLDQQNQLRDQAIPADLEATDHVGSIAFAEDLGHPALSGLDQADFFCWSGNHVVYRNAYKKGTKGFRSLIQCDLVLGDTALAECQVNEGLLLLCQVVVGSKLATDPVAQRLFDNLLDYAASYHAVHKATAVAIDPTSLKGKLLVATGLKFTTVSDPLAALDARYGVAVVEASPANLKVLAASRASVQTYTQAGGWLMLWGLTPEGLADYNQIVGFNHVIRPFQMERVTLATPRDPLTAGLSLRDVVMDSGHDIFTYMSLKFPAEDEFTSIVDYDEIGPFVKFPSLADMGQPLDSAPGWDHWPGNMVNNYTADDTWRLCYSIAIDRGQKTKWTMELPQPEVLTSFGIVLNVIYHKVTKINFYFDQDPTPFTITTRPTHDRQDFPIAGRKARTITMELAEWEKSGTANVIGIDNMWIGVQRPAEFLDHVKPLLNIGGLMRYNQGKGGILLNQLNILAHEANPVNAEKKMTITKTLLKNLGATFEGGATVVVGANLAYTPVELATGTCNAYTRKDAKPGWFKNGPGDLSQLPVGDQKLAGVPFRLPDFRTSPVPSVVMLKGYGSDAVASEVDGIKLGVKADALFFLHTFNATDQALHWKPHGGQTSPPVVFAYLVHYANGTTALAPVSWSLGVGNWFAPQPKALPGAQLAWTASIAGQKDDQAVVYAMQWDNPHPDQLIDSVDLMQDDDQWGCPVLLAVTSASVRK